MGGAINARLLSAAELVRQGAVFADIGTDHAYLPIFLLEQGKIRYAVCADINEGPLNSARANAKEAGLTEKVELILTDGAAALSGKGITDYAICGMGGELIAAIIDRAPHLRDRNVNLILGPNSRQGVLRKYLASHGFEIKCESYSTDAGKHYVTLLAAYTGVCSELDDAEAEIGIKNANYVNKGSQISYLKTKLQAFTKQRDGKIRGEDTADYEDFMVKNITERIGELMNE